MSEENKDKDKSGKLGRQETETRTTIGGLKPGFNPQKEALYKREQEKLIQKSPREADYTKMNSILSKQLGIQGRLADLQTKYGPQELFNQLNFMIENSTNTQSQGLPPNEDFVRITPGPDKFNLPGMPIGTQRMGKEDKFGLHIAFDPVKLFTPKKK